MKNLTVVSAISLLLSSVAMAKEVVLPPSKEQIRAFNECQRKGRGPCEWPERRVIIQDGPVVADPRTSDDTRVYAPAPPTELRSGEANEELRASIRDARGYRTYEWGILRTQDGPAEPFGSYGPNRSEGGASQASTASQGSTASEQGASPGRGSAPEGGNGVSGGSERGDRGDRGDGSRGGGKCAR